ncbi:hypothetical protein ES703_53276 [subsurface metagenome]
MVEPPGWKEARKEIDLPVGVSQSVCQEYTVNGAAGPDDRGGGIEIEQGSNQASAHAGNKVVPEESCPAPFPFQFGAEHPEHEHIKCHVPEAGMKKHIGEGLPDHEAGPHQSGHQSKNGKEHSFGAGKGHQDPKGQIDDDQASDDGRAGATPAEKVVASGTFILIPHGSTPGCAGLESPEYQPRPFLFPGRRAVRGRNDRMQLRLGLWN